MNIKVRKAKNMFKRLITTFLSNAILITGSSLPVLATEQEFEIEEMESVVEEMDSEIHTGISELEVLKTEKVYEETSQGLMKDPYYDNSLGLYEKDGLVYQLFEDGQARVQGGENQTITELFIPSKINFNGKEYKVYAVGHAADYNKYSIGKFYSRFTGLPNLKKIVIEDGIEWTISYAFSDCPNLEEIIYPNSITNYGQGSCYNCPKLKKVTLSNQTSIGKAMFANCEALKEITIPDGVKGIGEEAFHDCPNLKKIVIPNSVISFEERDEMWFIFNRSPNVTIFGSIPSEAYDYAQKHRIPFKELNSEPLPNIPSSGEMYRLYNLNSGEHFYTGNSDEKNQLSSIGWKYEGVAWYSPQTSNTPVYRLYNKNSSDHHYTTDSNEKDTLVRSGWKDEGIGWYSDDQKGIALYRVYNPNTKQAGSHHYTMDFNERNTLVSRGWKDEGIAWYGLK